MVGDREKGERKPHEFKRHWGFKNESQKQMLKMEAEAKSFSINL